MGWTVAGMGTQHSDTPGKRPHCLAVGRCWKDSLQLLTPLGSASVSSWDHIWKATLKQWLDAKEVLRAWMFHPNFNKQPFLWSFLRCWESLCNFGIKSLTLQYSCLENPLDRGTWWATVHEVMETDTMERLTHTHTIEEILDGARVHFIYSPISYRKQDGAGSTWEAGWLPPSPIPSGSLGASMPATAGLGQIKD